jgi:hypothetical protein
VGKGNCNVSFSAEGTETHAAAVTAAEHLNNRLREAYLLTFQFCSTGKHKYHRHCRNVINGFINDREEKAQLSSSSSSS